MRRALLIACASLVAAVFSWRQGEAQGQPFDLLIRNGLVVDGTGAPGRAASVGVRNGRIVEVGALNGATAARTLDATGLVVAPGFIDVHTHVDEIATQPAIPHFVRMGVTTVIAGKCGGSAAELREIETARPAINYATMSATTPFAAR